MLKYLQLPVHFDVQKMQADLLHLNKALWQPHYQKLHYEGEWSAIPLRSIEGNAQNIYVSPLNNAHYENTPLLEQTRYLKDVLAYFQCPLKGVRLLKLAAGAIIKEHRDAELHYEKGEIRIHIPVMTHPDVEFILDKERIFLQEGECWYMNFNLPHSVNNKSHQPRIHLVIDAEVNEWVEACFTHQSSVKKEIEKPQMDRATALQVIAQLRMMNTETSLRMAHEMESNLSSQ